MGPLSELRVLDMSRIMAGPYCTQLLGDFGADVIKIERLDEGDDTRQWGPPYIQGRDGKPTDLSAYFLAANRNKRSISLDISKSEGADTVKRLAAESDVFIENFKVGGLRKYGLDFQTLQAINPRLVYCSISGFGQTGPNADKPGYDLLAQAYGGIMSITGEPEGEPMKVGVGVADIVCGLYAANAILAAVRHRDKTGEGQHIDIALVDTQIAWLANAGTNFLNSGRLPLRLGNAHPNIVPYQLFKVADGHVVIAVGNDAQYRRFCDVIGRADLAGIAEFATNDARVANREGLIAILSEHLMKFTRDEIIDGLDKVAVPAGPVNDLGDVFGSPQVEGRGMKVSVPHPMAAGGSVELIGNPVKFSATPVAYTRHPPGCGEHSAEIMEELGAGSSALQKRQR